MIAVARMIRTSDPVESDELKDPEREQLRRVDPLREIDLAADLLLDALKDPQRALNDPIVPVRRMALRATGDLLATDAIHPPTNPKLIKKWIKAQKAKKAQEEQEKEQPKEAAIEQAAAEQKCGVCCEKEKEPTKPTPKPDEKPEPDPPSVVVGPDKLVILEPVHFALAKYDILPKSEKILKDVGTALKNHPEIKKVRVEGHTDVRATESYNQTLSENRVKSVVNWLVDKEGIDGGRLVGEGFGESRPLIKNAKKESDHFKNRRVEFVIVDGVVLPKPKVEESASVVEQNSDPATSVPDAKEPKTEGPCAAAEPPQIEPTPPKVDPVPPDVQPEKKKDPIPVQPDKLVVPEVLFDFNKDTLTKQSVEILKGVVETLKNHPEIKHVDVEGHTDSRGPDAYNLDLSQRRMNRVVDFLVKAGIDGKRLSGVGKGETELKIKNAKTSAEHHQNRRVEFKITEGPGIPSENAESPAGPQGGQFEPGEPQVEPEQGPKTQEPTGPKTQGPKNLGGEQGPKPLIKATAGPPVQTPAPKKTEEAKGAKGPKTEAAAEEEAETESQEVEAKEQTDQAADDAANPEGKGDAAPDGEGKGAEAPEGKDGGPAPSEAPLPNPAPPEAPKEPQKPKKLEAKTPAELAEQFAKASPTQKALSYGTLGKQMDGLSRDEQKQTQQGMPEFHATLKDQSPLPAGKGKVGPDAKADATPSLTPADVSTGQKGQLPKPNVSPPPKLGPFVPRPVTIPAAGGGTEQVVVQAKGEAGGALPESSGGEPLAPEVRAPMEQSFQADFSGVRVHTDGAGGATAFARGEHIHFAPGRYDPDTVQGREVLGHELAHVQQQRAGRVRVPQGLDLPINDDPALESEADVAGAKAARGERADVSGSAVGAPSGAVQGKGVVGNPLAQVQQVIRQVQTVDPGARAAKLGPAPKPALKGDANPALADAAAASGLTQAEAAKKAAQQKLLASPGAELVQPVRMDETHRVGELKTHKLEAPPEIPAVKQYVDLGLPGDVQAKFDDMYSAEMEKRLDGPRAKMRKATDDRDAKRDQALADADKKSAKLHEQSQKQQNQVIEEQRQRIHKERQVTLQAQEKALQDVRAQVAKERANVKGRISQRAKEDERRIDAAYADAQKRSDAQVASAEKQAAGLRRDAAQQVAKVGGQSGGVRPVQGFGGWKFLSSLASGAKDLWKKGAELVKSTLAEVGKAVNRVLTAARAAVAAIMEGVKKLATNIIALGAKFIVGLIAGFGKLVKGLITNTIGKVFPGLAKKLNQIVDAAVDLAKKVVNKVADLLKKGVAALCDGIVKVFNTILSVFNGLVQAALALTQFMLTGSFGEFGLKVLEAVLAMAGIDPAEFKAVFGKGEATVKTIIQNPRAFVSNATKAASQGFEKFSNNFQDHLQKGLVGWLTGELGDIKIPEKLNAAGVFDIVLQVVGLGPEQLKKKAAKLIGEKNVDRVVWVVNFIRDMAKDSEVSGTATGLAGLWTHLEKEVGNIWESVIGGIKNWLMTRIVMQAVMKLATMFNPIGALVQLVLTAWNLYCWMRDNTKRIWGVVTGFISSMADIAKGVTDGAAKKIEQALAGLLPIAISLLANLVGLKGVAAKVKQVIEKIQAKVDKAFDKLIERIKGLFPAAKGKEEAKKDAEPGLDDSWDAATPLKSKPSEVGLEKIRKLNVKGTYKLKIVNKKTFEAKYKKSGDNASYDVAPLHAEAKERVVHDVASGVATVGDMMFDTFGKGAYEHFAGQARKDLAKGVASEGLAVVSVTVTGDEPPTAAQRLAKKYGDKAKKYGEKAKEKAVKVGNWAKEKAKKGAERVANSRFGQGVKRRVIDPAKAGAAKVAQKLAAVWEKTRSKVASGFERAMAPLARKWEQGRQGFGRAIAAVADFVERVATGVKESRVGKAVGAAQDWMEALSERVRTQAVVWGKALYKRSEGIRQGATRIGQWFVRTAASIANKAEALVSWVDRAVKKVLPDQWYAEKAKPFVDKIAKAVSAFVQRVVEGARDFADRLTFYSGADRKRLKQDADKEGKEDPKPAGPVWTSGFDDQVVRSVLAARKRFVSGSTVITLWVDVSDGRASLRCSGARGDVVEQVALWKGRTSTLPNAVTAVAALGQTERVIEEFQTIATDLRALTTRDKRGDKERRRLADLLRGKLDAVGNRFKILYRVFGDWGDTAAEREGLKERRLERERNEKSEKDAKFKEDLAKARKEALKADLDKLKALGKEQVFGKEGEDAGPKKIKAHGWEFPEAASVLGKAGSVVMLGLKLPVAVEPIQFKPEVKIEGLGPVTGLVELWDAYPPESTDQKILVEYRAQRAALAARLALFEAAVSLLDPLLGETVNDENKRATAAVAVAQAAVVAARAAADVAKVVGLPKRVASAFQTALEYDANVGGSQAGWAFEDVKGVVEKERSVKVGPNDEAVVAKGSEGELKLDVGTLGKAEALQQSWRSQSDPTKAAALVVPMQKLDAALKKHVELAAKLGASVGLDPAGSQNRQKEANIWGGHVDTNVLPAIEKVGVVAGKPNESSRQAKASWKPIEVDLPRQKETMLIAHADGEKLALHVGALGTTHALARQYRARLEAEQLANPLARSVKGLKAALGTLVEANEAFDKATAAFQGSIGATEEEWEALRLDVSRKGEAVGKALEAVWASYGPPGAKGEDPWGNLLLRVPFKVGGGNIPAPPLGVERDTKANPTKGWEFPEAKALLGPLDVKVDGKSESLAVDEEKDPPVLILGKKTVADHLDEVLARAVSGAASANWRDARAAEGRFNAAMGQLAKYTDDDKYHQALRIDKATAARHEMAAVMFALDCLDPLLAPEKKAAPVKQTPAPPPAK